MTVLLALAAALAIQSPDDGPIRTGGSSVESAEAVRVREAIAYANPLPPGAPTNDYALVAWCDALVSGHVRLGETLTEPSDLDLEIMRLGRLEAADFRAGLTAARERQSPETLAAAEAAVAERTALWDAAVAREDEADRSQVFGLFFGLPGRCEHAARRLRDNVTTPPATPEEVGLE
ncbi:MAG: hypothetical protein ACI8U3_000284 [Brevundimonas sp.]|jgi:hypothetical protein|uniref:hypothetical protein n=1 Tax=Brevundimonas sp. TaxID=1871086 RepID=UPI0039E2E97D